MKKTLLLVVSGLLLFSVISCGDKKKSDSEKEESKASTLAELQKKYDDKDLEKCEDIISFYEEAMDVYCKTIDKAVKGDEKALEDYEAFEDYMDGYLDELEKFHEECPEKIEKMMTKLEEKLEKYDDKIQELDGSGTPTTMAELQDKYEYAEFTSCDDVMAFAEETFDVFFATIDRAYEGDEDAIADMEGFDAFFEDFESKVEEFDGECEDEQAAFEAKMEKKMEEYMPKLIEIYTKMEGGDLGEY
jgi:DNA-binding transcriptional MerR regulator